MTEKDKLYADELRSKALSDYKRLDHAINELERQTCDTPRNNLEITKENLEKMVKKVVQINKTDEYLLICNPLNTALKQEDLANNVELRHNPYCPIDQGYLIRKKDYLDI